MVWSCYRIAYWFRRCSALRHPWSSFLRLSICSSISTLSLLRFKSTLTPLLCACPSSQSGKTPLVQNLIAAGLLAQDIFAFYLTRNSAVGSTITLGGLNPSQYIGDITYTPVISQTYVSIIGQLLVLVYPNWIAGKESTDTWFASWLWIAQWEINATSINVNGVSSTSAVNVAVDTGTTFIYVPKAMAAKIVSYTSPAVSLHSR